MRSKRSATSSFQDGHVLAVVLVMVLILMSAGSLLALALRFQYETHYLENRDLRLKALTDAALAETLAELWNERDYGGFESYPFAGGTISSEVQRIAFQSREVIVRVTWGGGARAVRATVWVDVKDRAERPEVRGWKVVPSAAEGPTPSTPLPPAPG